MRARPAVHEVCIWIRRSIAFMSGERLLDLTVAIRRNGGGGFDAWFRCGKGVFPTQQMLDRIPIRCREGLRRMDGEERYILRLCLLYFP